MKIACTMSPERGDADLILGQLAERLSRRGLRVCGTVQVNGDLPESGSCDMDVNVLPDGPVIRISQSLGKAARGCRLDPSAIETAVGLTEARFADGADVLIVNKFGKHEAEGRGLRGAIAEAFAQGVPVLAGLSSLNEEAFETFAEGIAVRLPSEIGTQEDWICRSVEAATMTSV